jgi:antirestriction protein ArdC
MKANDVLEKLVDTLVEQMEAGAGEWKMPWHSFGMPHNAMSKRPYRGTNIVSLMFAGYQRTGWATYKQWFEAGCQVRKGEKATHVFLLKPMEREDDDGNIKRSTMMRTFAVFNEEQVDGWNPPPAPQLPEDQRLANLERAIAVVPAAIEHRGGRAYYSPIMDTVVMPEFAMFHSALGYYGTLAHELTHWTGHSSRLDRGMHTRFGDDLYAVEELIAELGSAMWCSLHGVDAASRDDHAAYLSSWIRVLKAEPAVLYTVASKAQAAVDLLCSYADEVAQVA